MFNSKYTLEIISQHPEFKNRALKKYNIEGIETVGAWGNEPFEIRFKNNTYQKIQIKLSLDGTDILTGEPATTEVTEKMWLVNAYGTLSIQAWPESNNGGARFVFTSADNSVALNTHGNMSSRGIIAAAVFVEGHVEPITVDHHHHHHHNHYDYYPLYRLNGSDYTVRTRSLNFSGGGTKSADSFSTQSYCSNNTSDSCLSESNTCSINNVSEANPSAGELKGLVSIGAGEYVNQKISYVQGLIKPMFSETLRVKYLWWDDLKAKLEQGLCEDEQPSGFPGDKPHKMINLGNTPRVRTVRGTFKRSVSQDNFSRF